MNPTGTVVVGVDGSPESQAAIVFAMREAARRQAWLRVIAAVQLPEYWTIAYGTADLPSPEEVIADTKRLARQTLDEVVDAHPELAAVGFDVEAIAGPAGQVLVEASEGADLLVLGHRGRGAVRSALLGSVGLHCLLHAGCPVTVVRPAAVAERPRSRPRPEEHIMRHTTVADVMSTSVISAGPKDTFAHLATLLAQRGDPGRAGGRRQRQAEGVVSEADLMSAVARNNAGDAGRWSASAACPSWSTRRPRRARPRRAN